MCCWFFFVWVILFFFVDVIVICSDVDDSVYCVFVFVFLVLVDLFGEGYGVLIVLCWVVIVVYVVFMEGMDIEVQINGCLYCVECVFVYFGYWCMFEVFGQVVLVLGNLGFIYVFFVVFDDIVLIQLVVLVSDVVLVCFYCGQVEVGKIVILVGKGVMGMGMIGLVLGGLYRGELCCVENVVIGGNSCYFWY